MLRHPQQLQHLISIMTRPSLWVFFFLLIVFLLYIHTLIISVTLVNYDIHNIHHVFAHLLLFFKIIITSVNYYDIHPSPPPRDVAFRFHFLLLLFILLIIPVYHYDGHLLPLACFQRLDQRPLRICGIIYLLYCDDYDSYHEVGLRHLHLRCWWPPGVCKSIWNSQNRCWRGGKKICVGYMLYLFANCLFN